MDVSDTSWAIGPFRRPVKRPIITPTEDLMFDCPMRKTAVRWARNHTFNPAATVHEDKVQVLFRAEDGHGDQIAAYTSRIGKAVSKDGISFDIEPEPVIFPANDGYVACEWYGGCEDPRVVRSSDDEFVAYYTMYNRDNPEGAAHKAVLGVASSRDLRNWQKHGAAFAKSGGITAYHKAAGVVQRVENGRLVATTLGGKYWMYWGERSVCLATSDDLIHWTPVCDEQGRLVEVISPREGHFDSALSEVGPNPVLTDKGIVLMYNGKNHKEKGDPGVGDWAYAPGQVLLDPDAPWEVLDRLDQPFLKPDYEYEQGGQYAAGTVFAEGLVLFNGKWHLYYGCSDTYVGVASAPLRNAGAMER